MPVGPVALRLEPTRRNRTRSHDLMEVKETVRETGRTAWGIDGPDDRGVQS